jgi:hypothetical protein
MRKRMAGKLSKQEHDRLWPWCQLPQFVMHWHDEAWHPLARRPGCVPVGATLIERPGEPTSVVDF